MFLLSRITASNLSTYHCLPENQSIATLLSNLRDFSKSSKESVNELEELSAKLPIEAFSIKTNKSSKFALNRIGPTTDPCSTPGKML